MFACAPPCLSARRRCSAIGGEGSPRGRAEEAGPSVSQPLPFPALLPACPRGQAPSPPPTLPPGAAWPCGQAAQSLSFSPLFHIAPGVAWPCGQARKGYSPLALPRLPLFSPPPTHLSRSQSKVRGLRSDVCLAVLKSNVRRPSLFRRGFGSCESLFPTDIEDEVWRQRLVGA